MLHAGQAGLEFLNLSAAIGHLDARFSHQRRTFAAFWTNVYLLIAALLTGNLLAHAIEYLAGDVMAVIEIATEQGAIKQRVDTARHAARDLVDALIDCLIDGRIVVPADLAHAVFDVQLDLGRR